MGCKPKVATVFTSVLVTAIHGEVGEMLTHCWVMTIVVKVLKLKSMAKIEIHGPIETLSNDVDEVIPSRFFFCFDSARRSLSFCLSSWDMIIKFVYKQTCSPKFVPNWVTKPSAKRLYMDLQWHERKGTVRKKKRTDDALPTLTGKNQKRICSAQYNALLLKMEETIT